MSTNRKYGNAAEAAPVRRSTRLSDASRMASLQVKPANSEERDRLRAIHQILVQHDSLPESERAGFLKAVLQLSEEALKKQLKAELKEWEERPLQEELDREYEDDLNEYRKKTNEVIARIYGEDFGKYEDLEDFDL